MICLAISMLIAVIFLSSMELKQILFLTFKELVIGGSHFFGQIKENPSIERVSTSRNPL